VAWELEEGTIDGADLTLVEGHPITLSMTDGQASGTAACNGYFGTVSISGAEISFTGLGATEMACSPEEVMESERRYLEALTRVTGLSVGADSLSLTGDGVELVFTALPPVPTAELTGTVWVLESLIDGDSVSSVGGDRATLELYTDGSMLGSTGCRTLHGRYDVVGAEVTMPEMAAEGECPTDLQDQDNHVVSVLGDGFRAAVEGDLLTLDSAGGLGLAYRAEG
jgi:heat shock protein HslJ